jgi:hypothetical protein
LANFQADRLGTIKHAQITSKVDIVKGLLDIYEDTLNSHQNSTYVLVIAKNINLKIRKIADVLIKGRSFGL